MVQLRIKNETVFELPIDNDDGFVLLLRIMVILLKLPKPGIFDRLKRTAETSRATSHIRQKQPLTNSVCLLLRHVLQFVGLIRKKNKSQGHSDVPVNYNTTVKVMTKLKKLAKK